MVLEPISEQEEDSSFCFCCGSKLPPEKNEASRAVPETATMERASDLTSPAPARTRPKLSKKYQSVYISAREILGDKELACLKEFEDAAMESIGGDESVYFDALDVSDKMEDLTYAPAKIADPRPRASVSMADPTTLLAVMKELQEPRVKVECPGYPGQLTKEELAACQKFRDELKKKKEDTANNGKTYEDVVRIYDPVETEPYALCRFLRARQFDTDKVFEMITEILDVWREAQKHDYYPGRPNEFWNVTTAEALF